eukprot:214745-Hanusia_phi.AAC.1
MREQCGIFSTGRRSWRQEYRRWKRKEREGEGEEEREGREGREEEERRGEGRKGGEGTGDDCISEES